MPIYLPPSKSQLQRALVAAALAHGPSHLDGHGLELGVLAADVEAAVRAARALGAEVFATPDGFDVHPGVRSPIDALDCGESALLLRLMLPIGACLGFPKVLSGRGSLLDRPIESLLQPLEVLGARFTFPEGATLPVTIAHTLHGGALTLDASLTSQLASGVSMALPLCASPSRLTIQNLASRPYLDLTLDVARAFGIELHGSSDTGVFEIPGAQRYRATALTIEADWSAAAFLLVLGAIHPEARIDLAGLDRQSRQADRAILDILRSVGAQLEWRGELLRCRRGALRALDFSLGDTPDLLPPLAVLALFCPGTSRLRGIARTRFKESDRPVALREVFSALGARLWVEGADLFIDGALPLHGGAVSAHGDHRIAMSLGIANLAARVPIEIQGGREAVKKSFPNFFEVIAALA
ncbi:MAG: 3-phosphoshikimate 1-carboxyvinyltransferase [Myxococcales bacterium]|jgi:3-phosphoshikimate 1-carboxyvinyltransferase|nr:3-phosphoshikimate 1-carboxyvinyltransferase [Myxococcales bacterium]